MALKTLFDLHRTERAPTLLMSLYFFFVITVFWILKPLKKSLFLRFYSDLRFDPSFGLIEGEAILLDGPQAELFAKVLNMIVAGLATALSSPRAFLRGVRVLLSRLPAAEPVHRCAIGVLSVGVLPVR
jgi:hypothetical protein